ncbi:helix-turn-helix protein [Hydrogenispora ethanolica]|uniref:Helix-turn-helix protein n=1 Tax=Hydrogenispora ethanolica TaxID=1082276 RepID=A0A4V2QBZ6_HYDET|nr:helix-turn-helix transcriptional regulator [Hydrogenispora ethanolica]TCL58337.1 helix-turn-helix protein [Hydrogenispora ethanolica]
MQILLKKFISSYLSQPGPQSNVEEIAEHCCFSKYYFNRVFKSVVNDSIYAFIKRVKLENAAFKLRTKKRKPITDIAFEVGYSPSNFAAAFKAGR